MVKNRKKLIAGIALGLCMTAFAAAGLAGCGGSKTWDVSADSSSSVKATLEKSDGGYQLTIRGNGSMADFSSASDAPWSKHAGEINAVTVSYGVEGIGSNAFAGITDVEYIVFPSSVTHIGQNVTDEKVKIFAFDEQLEYDGTYDNIYTYTEKTIETNDRFWQSDKSKGDIVADGEDLTGDDGKYWHYVEDTPAVYEKIKALFIGNSFTYRNGRVEFSSGVPGIFDNIAEDLGYAVETYSITGPGWYLENHAKATDTCGRQVDKLLNACDDFDYIVLQDQSTVAFENYERFSGGIAALKEKIEATQTDAKIYLYETWGSPFSANERNITVPEMEKLLFDAYNRAADEFGLSVSYIGAAFTDIYLHEPSIYLYDTDNRHQGYTGAYLSACVHAASMLGADVRKTTFVGEAQYNAPELDEATLTALRTAAYNAVFAELTDDRFEADDAPSSGEQDDEQKEILKIACWGRFMKEAKFEELVEDFKLYCAQEGITYKEIVATYYDGATTSQPYYYIANFTAKVYADGNPDIVLPCADNFNANQATIAAVDMVPVDVYGQTDRRVAAINDDALTLAFMDYVQTASAAEIMARAD